MLSFLKIKIKSLAAEAVIIRKEESKASKEWISQELAKEFPSGLYNTSEYALLHEHRVNEVRKEQRSASLAYGFLRGTPYTLLERNPKTKPDWKRIASLCKKFGPKGKDYTQELRNWCDS